MEQGFARAARQGIHQNVGPIQRAGQRNAHELYPLSIVVHEDVAIAHYLFTSATEDKNKDGKIETANGRYTDILVRTDDGWKFIAWSGGSDDD